MHVSNCVVCDYLQ